MGAGQEDSYRVVIREFKNFAIQAAFCYIFILDMIYFRVVENK